jgi:ATP-dependent exoDNAse (exonuclease V) beta subunit
VSGFPFTAEQLKAVDTAQKHLDACVTAGPGSGKTTVLVEYFRRLVADGTDPRRILAITFTEKAAANMRAKLAEAFQEDTILRARLERAWVSTVDGFCAGLLRDHAITAGVDPDFGVADERESWRLQHEAITEAISALLTAKPEEVRALIRGLVSYEFEDLILSAYDAMRSAGMSIESIASLPEPGGDALEEAKDALSRLRADALAGWNPAQKYRVRSMIDQAARVIDAESPLETLRALKDYKGTLNGCKRGTTAYEIVSALQDSLKERLPYSLITWFYEGERATLLEILRRFDRVYRERKQAAGVLDFGDMEEYAVNLLDRNPEARAEIQAQFDYILMDEFQDTNGQQAKLLDLLRRPGRFYAVGDINQSIFGFRHAEPEVFRRYRNDVARGGRRLIDLTGNFRSRADILAAVESLAGGMEGIEPRPLIAEREFQEPRAVAVEVMGVLGPDADEALRNEGKWVARRILELRAEDGQPRFGFKDFALLVRNTEVIPEFTRAFDEAGIPYVVNRGKGFYEAREVKDLVHLLRVLSNPHDEFSLAAVLRSPLVGASDEALLGLRAMGGRLGDALNHLKRPADVPFREEDYRKLTDFRDRLHDWRARREYISFDRVLLAAVDACGYSCEGARGRANLEKFLAQAREAATRMSIDEFVERLARIRGDDLREPDAPPEDVTEAVNVMTVHSAKGLEFPVVIVAALHKGVDSNPSVLAFSRQYGLGARWRNPASGEEKSDVYLHAIHEERKQREGEESNRLLYVAMTRAEQHLVLSFSGSGKKPKHWAKLVSAAWGVALDEPRDEIVRQTTRSGIEWLLRIRVAAGSPERLEAGAIAAAADPTEWLERPPVADQQDTNATVTDLAAFAKCPRDYYLGHYLGFEGRASTGTRAGGLAAGEFGSMVHALLAGNPVPGADPAAIAMAEVFRQSALGRRVARASRIEREFDFLMSVEELVLRGQIDLWFEEGGEVVIVDYKTDAVSAIEAHQRAQEYAVQVRLYALAVERITGRPPDQAWLHFLRPNTMIAVDLTPSLLDSPGQIVLEFQEAQSRLEFPLREGAHCHRCRFFRDLCPAGGVYNGQNQDGERTRAAARAQS